MKIVTLSSKNQITIPKEAISQFGPLATRRLLMEFKGNQLVLKPLAVSIVKETAGSLRSYIAKKKRGKSFKSIMEETKRKAAKDLAKNL